MNDTSRIESLKAAIVGSSPEVRLALRDFISQQFDESGNDTKSETRLFPFIGEDDTAKFASPQFIAFINAIAGDDLSAILKGQIHIERLLETIISQTMAAADTMFDGFLTYDQKVELVRRLRPDIPKEVITRLRRVSEVRNRFGHHIGKMYFDQTDIEKLAFKMSSGDKMWVDWHMRDQHPNEPNHGDKVRLLLHIIYLEVIMIRDGLTFGTEVAGNSWTMNDTT